MLLPVSPFDHITVPLQSAAVNVTAPPAQTVSALAVIVGITGATTLMVYTGDDLLVQVPFWQYTQYELLPSVGVTTMLDVVAVVLFQCGVPMQFSTVSVTVSPGHTTDVLQTIVG